MASPNIIENIVKESPVICEIETGLNDTCDQNVENKCKTDLEETLPNGVGKDPEHQQDCLEDTCDKPSPSAHHPQQESIIETMHRKNLIIIERTIYKFYHRNLFLINKKINLLNTYKQTILPTVMEFGARLVGNLATLPAEQLATLTPEKVATLQALAAQLPALAVQQLSALPAEQINALLQQLAPQLVTQLPLLVSLNPEMAIRQIFFIISANIYLLIPQDDSIRGLLLYWHFYFSAWESPKFNEVYLLDGTGGNYYNGVSNAIRNYIDETNIPITEQISIMSKMNRSEIALHVIYVWGSSSYVYISIGGEDIVLFEFFYADNENFNQLTQFGDFFNGMYISPQLLTLSFPDLAFMPATKNKFPIQSGIEHIFNGIKEQFKNNEPGSVKAYLSSIQNKPGFVYMVNMINYYSDSFMVSFNFPNGVNNLAKETQCNYDSGEDYSYDEFNNILNGEPRREPEPIQFSKFKKYLENYIVNYCTEEHPSLKMVAFLKISYLNKFMIDNNWGFVDTAGGSLFNYLKRGFNVVTADYDFKIYFYSDPVSDPHNIVREMRKAFIKCWFINISHQINEYMRTNLFLKNIKIVGSIVDTGITYEITPITKRHFISRGKEPDIFPVPLYSDDLLLSIKFIKHQENGKPFTQTENMNVSYFDLVFKDFNHHYIGELGPEFALQYVSLFSCVAQNIQNYAPNRGVPNPFFLVRTPTFYEIWMDVTSLLIDAVFLLNRLCTGKHEKDKIRVTILIPFILKKIEELLQNQGLAEIIQLLQKQGLSEEIIQFIKFYGFLTTMLNPDNITPENVIILNQLNSNPLFKDILLRIDITQNHNEYIIQNCYYQFILFCKYINNDSFPNYDGIKNLISSSFSTVFVPITKIYWTFLLCTKKYSEFKAGTDITRINKIRDYIFPHQDDSHFIIYNLPNETINPSATYDKIVDKLSDSKRNPMNDANFFSYAQIRDFLSVRGLPSLGAIMAGGSSKKHTRKHIQKHKYSKRNKKSKKNNKSIKHRSQISKKNQKIKRRHRSTTKK